ncbi:phosphatidate cytidylyltransferase [Chryseobacterium sp. T1]
MKKYSFIFMLLAVSSLLTSCEAINTIFKAGMWWAFILMFLVVVAVIWIISKIMGGGKK